MAKIPLFFRSTFPVETYGALWDPGMMGIVEAAKKKASLAQMVGSEDLIGAYLSASRLQGPGAASRGGGVNKSTEATGILDRANSADAQASARGIAQDRHDTAMQAAADRLDAAAPPARSKPITPKTYKVPGA